MSFPGQVVNTAGPWSWAAVARDIWLTLLGFLHGPESHRRPGQPCGPSDQGKSQLRYQVDLAGPGTHARVTRECWSTLWALRHSPSRPGELVDPTGHRNRARFAWESWSNPRDLRPKRE